MLTFCQFLRTERRLGGRGELEQIAKGGQYKMAWKATAKS